MKMPAGSTLAERFSAAASLFGQGQLAAAARACESVLAEEPRHADALHLLGIITARTGDASRALALLETALQASPGNALLWDSSAGVLQALGRHAEALERHDRALALMPGLAGAWYNRGNALRALGRSADAVTSYERALAIQPDHADAWCNCGNALLDLGESDRALDSFEQALRVQPHHPAAHFNRGNGLLSRGRLQAAADAYEQAIRSQPNFAAARLNRAVALRELQRPEQALDCLDGLLRMHPEHAQAWSNRGELLQLLGRSAEAVSSYDRAIGLCPDSARFHADRASVLLEWGRLPQVIEGIERVMGKVTGADAATHIGLLVEARARLCDWHNRDGSIGILRQQLQEGNPACLPFSALLVMDDPQVHARCSALLARRIEQMVPPAERAGTPDGVRRNGPRAQSAQRIRVAYYSADYHDHATAYLIAGLIEAHDRSQFEICGFSFGPDADDAMQRRLAAAFDRFERVRQCSDVQIVHRSRELQIDLAIDLKGHTQGSRTALFARGCAPVQAAYLGYPGTLGADWMHYIIADATVLPPGEEVWYREKVVRLPDSYQANDAARPVAGRTFSRAELGLPERGFVFCCFNNTAKIAPESFACWMRILGTTQGSVLWLYRSNPWVAENLRRAAAVHGIEPARLIFADPLPVAEHLARQCVADLFLDTLPYNAHTTASDALWAGLPVLTLAGKAFAGRVAASLLKAVGLPELVTGSIADYEALAIRVAGDPQLLGGLRRRLALNRGSAALFDTRGFTRNLEAAYAGMHERDRRGLPPAHLFVSNRGEVTTEADQPG